MKKITLKYRLRRWLPFQKKLETVVPSSWEDLSGRQLVAMIALEQKRISELEFIHQMTGIRVKILRRFSEFQLYRLAESFEFLSENKAFHRFIIDRIVVPTGGFNRQVLLAPQPKLKAVTFGQFIFANTYFLNYHAGKREDDLNKFIAALYLQNNEKFEERLIQERFAKVGKLELCIRLAIALNYQLIHEWLSLAYPLIFQKREEFPDQVASSDSQNGSQAGDILSTIQDTNIWIKIFQNFVGDDILNDEQWAGKPINTILTYMTRKYKENARKKIV
jgi:hypothetical protein